MAHINQFLVYFGLTICLLGPHNSLAANAPWLGESLKGRPCTKQTQGFGPFDYTLRYTMINKLHLVESAHFTPSVENLIKGKTSTQLIDDMEYTLRAWPNHHRALNSLIKYKLLYPRKKQPTSQVECYFQRAINFSQKDSTTRMLYGMYLHKTKNISMAEKQYEIAIELSPNNPVIRYNYGLLLFGQKKYAIAQEQAIIAYKAKFPLNGLKNKLKRVKFWPPKEIPKSVETQISEPPKIIKKQ